MRLKQFKSWEAATVVGSIKVVGTLTCCVLLHSVYDLKAAQMNVLHSLIRELILYEFKQDYTTTEAATFVMQKEKAMLIKVW